jgi:hypothetical protein
MKKLLKLEDEAAAAAQMDTFGETATTTTHPPICCLLLHQLESADTGEKNAKNTQFCKISSSNEKCSDADAAMTQFSS